MDELITARYHLTEQDYTDVCVANYRYLWRRISIPKKFVATVFLVGLLVLAAVGWFVSRGGAAMLPAMLLLDLPIALLILGALADLLHPENFLNRLWYRHNFRSIAEGSRSIEWGFDQDILWASTSLAEGKYRWELFPTIVETPKCFLFYLGQQTGALAPIPRILVAGDAADVHRPCQGEGSKLRCAWPVPISRQARARWPE